MAVVFVGLTTQLADLGLGPALVQRSELTQVHKSTAFWSAVLAGLLLGALFYVSAPAIGNYYRTPSVVPIVRVLGLTFLLGAPESIFRYLLERDLAFRLIGLRRLVGVAISGTVGIAMALSGFGVWALVAEQLVRTAAGSALYWISHPWRPSAQFSRQALGEMWRYSRSIVGTRLVNFFNRNLDSLAIGRYLGETALGHYGFAYQGVLLPLQQIARPIASVGFPTFASIQGDLERCRKAYLSALRVSLLAAMPLPLLAIFLSPLAIPLLLGPEWEPSITAFQILSGVAVIQVGMSLSPPLFNALGRADLSFKWTIIALAANAVGIFVGLRWGINGVAWGYLIAVALTAPVQFAMLTRLLSLRPSRLFGVFGPMALVIPLTCIAPLLISFTTDLSPIAELFASGSTLIAGYLLTSRLFAKRAWKLLLRSATSVAKKRDGGPGGERGS